MPKIEQLNTIVYVWFLMAQMLWYKSNQRKKNQLVITITFFEMFKLLTFSRNARLNPWWNVTLHTLEHSEWHADITVHTGSLSVLQCLWNGRMHILFQVTPKEKFQCSENRRTWKQIFDTTIPNYFIPKLLDEALFHWSCIVRRWAVMLKPQIL